MIVPEKKIAVIPTREDPGFEPITFEGTKHFIHSLKNSRKRDWFKSEFYKCLPLAIGNTQGFAVTIPFDLNIFWNGGSSPHDLSFAAFEDEKEYRDKWQVSVKSHFGHGIFTINLPVMFRTPPGVNLLVTSAPNFITPGLNAMTAVVEADNLRYTFTVNIKVNQPNMWIHIPAMSPVASIIPIPRYFCDEFELVDAYDIFTEEEVEEEKEIHWENSIVDLFLRENEYDKWWDGCYFDGTDIRGNKFDDHQLPNSRKKNNEDRTDN